MPRDWRYILGRTFEYALTLIVLWGCWLVLDAWSFVVR